MLGIDESKADSSIFHIPLTVSLYSAGKLIPMEINYTEASASGSLFVKVAGDCDMYSAEKFFSGVTEKMSMGFSRVFLDFSEVIYLDSSGIGAIIRIIKRSKEKNIDLRFRGISGTPRKVLRMSNILTLINEET